MIWAITNGVKGTGMAGFAQTIPLEDRWHIVNYLRTMFPPIGG